MKTTNLFRTPALAALLAIALVSSARAADRRSQRQPPRQGLQNAEGLQAAQIEPSAPLSPKLTDEEWRKLFPVRKPEVRSESIRK